MKNICRPIILYNVHVPAKKFEYEWKYTAFGVYDGIDIRENIWKENTDNFAVLMDEWLIETLHLNGNYSKEIMFAIRDDDNNEEENFWNESSYPYIFFVSLYMHGRARNWKKLYKHIENSINTSSYKEEVMAICYQTLDNSDLLLVIKSKNYDSGTDIINLFHDEKNQFIYKYDEKNFESITLHYSYTISGFDRDIELDEKYQNNIIEEVSFFAFEKKPGSISLIMKEIENYLKNTDVQISKVELLGSNDEKIIFKNISWGDFMHLYQKESPVLTNENAIYCDSICYGSTQLNHKKRDKNQLKIFKGANNYTNAADLVTNEGFCLNKDEIDKLKLSGMKKGVNNALELEYIKAIAHIENSMQKFKDSAFPSYVYTAIFQPMKLFIKQLVAYRNKEIENIEKCTNNGIFDFLNSVSIVIQNTSRMNRDFLQTPDFNVVINDVPIKLFAFYAAWTYKVTQILNTNNSDINKQSKEYSVLVCPGLEKIVEIDMVFPKFPPKDRLLLVKAPERVLYNPGLLSSVLVHEISHYVGDLLRKREKRYKNILEIYSQIIIIKFEEYFNNQFSQYISDGTKSKIYYSVMKRAKSSVDKYEKQHEEYILYKYYTDFFKKISDDIIKSFIIEDFDLIYEDVKKECLRSLIDLTEDTCTLYSDEFVNNYERGFDRGIKIDKAADRLKRYFKKHSKIIINNVNNIAKEIFADLICILLLEISGDIYLYNIYCSINEVSEEKNANVKKNINNNIINIRTALVVRCMQLTKIKKGNTDIDCKFFWEKSLLEITHNKANDLSFKEWLESLNRIMKIVYEPDDILRGETDILLHQEIWDYFIDYLAECKLAFQEWKDGDSNLKKEINNLKDMYQSISVINDLEETTVKIRKFIDEHKENLKNSMMSN
ncbi:MAG: hypothetical protein HFE59_09085 [Clostridiales bacterium]|nr:hypothetical protein [Clostridiales bacterium]